MHCYIYFKGALAAINFKIVVRTYEYCHVAMIYKCLFVTKNWKLWPTTLRLTELL